MAADYTNTLTSDLIKNLVAAQLDPNGTTPEDEIAICTEIDYRMPVPPQHLRDPGICLHCHQNMTLVSEGPDGSAWMCENPDCPSQAWMQLAP